MEKKEGKIPVNARVDIDYSNGKPKIKFGYTSRRPMKDAITQNSYGYIWMLLMVLLMIIPIYTYDDYLYKIDYPKYCNVSLNEGFANVTLIAESYENWNYTNFSVNTYKRFVKGANFTCDNGNYSVKFDRTGGWRNRIINKLGGFENYDYHFYSTWEQLIFPLTILALLMIITVINIFATKWIVRQKWYQKWLPKHMAGNPDRKKKYYKFKPEDVIDNVVIVPEFKNVELIYKTDGEFSKYLKSVKIREHRHRVYRKQKVGKLKVNNYRWYAIFTFTEKPKSGFLEVIYQ